MTNRERGGWSAELIALRGCSGLERQWTAIDATRRGSVFQTWEWVGTWIDHLPLELQPQLLRVWRHGDLVALGIFVPSRRMRHGVIPSRVMSLHETGRFDEDCLTMEHNDLVAHAGYEVPARRVALDCLTRARRWNELAIGGADEAVATAWIEAARDRNLRLARAERRPFYCVDLRSLRGEGGEYLAALSGNTRYQVRRAMREYERQGELRLTPATTPDQALDYFERLRGLHQKYWAGRGQPGAFSRPFFERFHYAFIRRSFAAGRVQLLRVASGPHEIGYLYNLVHRGRVCSYQSGFAYRPDGGDKPGLVSHVLAVEHALAAGHDQYDLLAGEAQYKRSLATRQETMCWLALQRPQWRFRLEAAARGLYEKAKTLPLPLPLAERLRRGMR